MPLIRKDNVRSARMKTTSGNKYRWIHLLTLGLAKLVLQRQWQTRLRRMDLRKILSPTAFALCLCALAAPGLSVSQQSEPLKPFEAKYIVGNNLLTAAQATVALTGTGDTWIYSLSIAPTGLFKLSGKGRIEEISTLNFADSQFQSLSYNHRQLGDEKRDVSASFDWENNQFTYQYRGEEHVEEFSEPVHDRLSITLTVRERLRSGFEELTFQVFDRGRIKSVGFKNEGTETLDTKLGKLDAYKIRSHNGGGTRKRVTTTWYAPTLDFLPVKIEQHKEGKLIARLSISTLTQ